MIVNRFPESQPKIEHAESTGKAAHKPVRYEAAQTWGGEKQGIICPMLGPGQNNQKNAKSCTHGHEQQCPDSP